MSASGPKKSQIPRRRSETIGELSHKADMAKNAPMSAFGVAEWGRAATCAAPGPLPNSGGNGRRNPKGANLSMRGCD